MPPCSTFVSKVGALVVVHLPHVPLCRTLTLLLLMQEVCCRTHWFAYVLPSVPHTGSKLKEHAPLQRHLTTPADSKEQRLYGLRITSVAMKIIIIIIRSSSSLVIVFVIIIIIDNNIIIILVILSPRLFVISGNIRRLRGSLRESSIPLTLRYTCKGDEAGCSPNQSAIIRRVTKPEVGVRFVNNDHDRTTQSPITN